MRAFAITCFAVTAVMAACQPSLAQAGPTELFGISLGANLSTLATIGEPDVTMGLSPAPDWTLRVTPPLPNPAFVRYTVNYNPKTNEVYSISATGTVRESECGGYLQSLGEYFEVKYPDMKPYYNDKRFALLYPNKEGSAPLNLSCSGSSASANIWLFLTDWERFSEHQRQNAGSIPTTGL